jgi:hypothetical protein
MQKIFKMKIIKFIVKKKSEESRYKFELTTFKEKLKQQQAREHTITLRERKIQK